MPLRSCVFVDVREPDWLAVREVEGVLEAVCVGVRERVGERDSLEVPEELGEPDCDAESVWDDVPEPLWVDEPELVVF